MKQEQVLFVEQSMFQEMERIVREPDSSVKGDGVEFDEEVKFDNGYWMVIQVCASGNPAEESCWTQGVLYSPCGTELGCTTPGDKFGQEYRVMDDDDEYVVQVKSK
jgi:hypothetical protein